MKKLFLLSLAVAGAATSAMAADEYVTGGVATYKEGYKLEVLWGNTEMVGNASCRVGTGTNDRFFLNDYANGTVKVYDEMGFVKDIKVADHIWVSNNADNAGHIITRADKQAWPGGAAYAGAGNPGDTGFYIIDGKTMEVVSPHLLCDKQLRPTGRCDVFGHINYDVTEGMWALYHCFDGSPAFGAEILFDGTSECLGASNFRIGVPGDFAGTAAATVQTLAIAQPYGEYVDFYGMKQYKNLAVYTNARIDVTGSSHGLGNGIRRYSLDITTDEYGDEVATYKTELIFFVTPQHSSINGFMVFELAGKQYIVYSAGESGGVNAGDAYGIAEVKYVETAKNDDEVDKEVLVARMFPSMKNDAIQYGAKSNYISFNVEPVENEPNSVYIYTFCQGCPMVKSKFTAPDTTGVEDLMTEDNNAPVEYYNLQGVRVANPENGMFIKRQGAKAYKVAL